MTYRNLMLDLETWGTSPGCAIRSIGAVLFDFGNSNLGRSYYANVDEESCVALGLRIEPLVVAWWGEQSPESQAALDTDRLPISTALDGLLRLIAENEEPEELCVWSHGATFDIPITDYALRAANRRAPWKYQNGRDTRTLIWLGEQLGHTVAVPRIGIRHHALDDAKSRALQMIALLDRIAP